MKTMLVLVSLAATALQATAESKIWVGESGGDWNEAVNWRPEGVPTKVDTAVFRSEGTLTVRLSAMPDGIGGLRFERGTTILQTVLANVTGSPSGSPLAMPSGTNVFYAAAEAMGVISNVFNGRVGAVLAKEGPGEIVVAAPLGTGYGYFDAFDIREGTVATRADISPQYALVSAVRIRAGAVLRTARASSVHPNFAVSVEAGGVWDWGEANQTFAAIAGSGDLANFPNGYNLTDEVATKLDGFTGRLVLSSARNLSFTFSSVRTLPFAVVTEASDDATMGTVKAGWGLFKNTQMLTLDRLLGNGVFSFFGPTAVLRAETTGALFWLNEGAEVSVAGGTALLAGDQLKFRTGAKLRVENGAYVGRVPAVPSDGWTSARRPTGVTVVDQPQVGQIEISSGGTFFSASGLGAKTVTVTSGGTFALGSPIAVMTGSSADDPAVLSVEGGMLALHTETARYTFNVTPDSDAVRVTAGAGGLTIDCDMETKPCAEGEHEFCFRRPLFGEGGVVRTGGGFLYGTHPWQIAGAFDCRDGVLEIRPEAASVAAAKVPLFGTGDFRLGNARLQFRGDTASTSAIVAKVGTGGVFAYDGAATVRTRSAATLPRHGLELGSLTRGGAGAALFFWCASGAAYEDVEQGGGRVTFSSAPEMDASGRVAGPVFVFDRPEGWNYGRIGFAAYDASGLVPFSNYAKGLDGGGESVALLTDGERATVSGTVTVAALRVDGDQSVPASGDAASQSVLQILSGGCLCVGGASGPGCIILNNRHSGYTPATIKGSGVLDFGAHEGVITVNGKSGGVVSFARVDAKISGSDGLSVVGVNDVSVECGLELRGENDYTGGTRVNGAFVRPTTADSLSSGAVYLGDGELCGGALQLDTEGLTIPNDILAAGWGPRLLGEVVGGRGAIVFKKGATLTGAVEAYRPLRLGALNDAEIEGVFTGCISGDRIQVWGPDPQSPTAGAIVFAGANTYTGGTEVVSATLVLRDGGTAGTGPIWLSGGTLSVEGAEPQTVLNRVTGLGTIRVSGKGEKSFGALESEDGVGFTLEVGKGRRAFVRSLEGISAVVSSAARPVELWVSEVAERGTFAGSVAENVTLCYGERGTPGGLLIIR